MMKEFSNSELEELAEMVCGRVDSLKEIEQGMVKNKMPDSAVRAIRNDIASLKSLDDKFRPHYKGGE
jgi:hypothetical protein